MDRNNSKYNLRAERRKINVPLLLQHIGVLFLVLLLLFGMIVALFQLVLLPNLNEYNSRQHRAALEYGVDAIGQERESFTQLLSMAALEKPASPYLMARGNARMEEGQKAIGKLIQPNRMITECVLVSGRYGFGVSNLTSYRFYYFLRTMDTPVLGGCSDYNQAARKLLEHPVLPMTVRGESVVSFQYPFRSGGADSRTVAMLLVPVRSLLDTFGAYIVDRSNSFSLIYMDGSCLGSTLPGQTPAPDWETLQDRGEITLGDTAYYVLLHQDQETDLCSVYLIDRTSYGGTIAHTTRQCFLWLTLIFVLAACGLTGLSYYNDKPILALQEMLSGYFQRDSAPGRADIAADVQNLIEHNRRLSNQLDVTSKSLKNFYLSKLLHCPAGELDAVRKNLAELHIHLDRACFQCICLNLHDSRNLEKFQKRIEEECRSRSPYCTLHYAVSGTDIALIFNFHRQDLSMVRFLVQNFCQFYVGEIQMNMGISDVGTGLQSLPTIYNQSQMALRYSQAGDETSLSQYNESSLQEAVESLYNSNQITTLLNAIRKDDMDAISSSLRSLKVFFLQSKIPRYAIKGAYYQIVNDILSTSNNPVIFEKGNQLLMAIGESLQKYSLDDLHLQIEDLCAQMVHQASSVVLLDRVLDYIQTHFSDCNFSIANMAEYFQMSHQNMGLLFRKEMNMTIIDYVTGCRITAAEKLLIDTDLPISEIVQRVGYIDSSSFTRKFKKIKEIPPAEYRRTYRS